MHIDAMGYIYKKVSQTYHVFVALEFYFLSDVAGRYVSCFLCFLYYVSTLVTFDMD